MRNITISLSIRLPALGKGKLSLYGRQTLCEAACQNPRLILSKELRQHSQGGLHTNNGMLSRMQYSLVVQFWSLLLHMLLFLRVTAR
jgi:hypothetical protein